MSDLVWRREKEELHRTRRIICEVPELLMKTLEHDYTTPYGLLGEGEDPIEIRYYHEDARHYRPSGYSMKGAAWAHLQKNPPIIEVELEGETEFFKPVFEEKFNPYRKRHANDYWGWYVLRWELIPPPEDPKKVGIG